MQLHKPVLPLQIREEGQPFPSVLPSPASFVPCSFLFLHKPVLLE